MTKAVTKLVTIFFLCTMSIGLIAQNFTIQGEVQKADGSAVEGTEVLLTTEIGLQFTEITDVNGFYQHAFDNLLPDSSLVTVSLTDICSGQLLEQYTLAYGNITVDVDFTVCTSNPQDSCMAMFYYEQIDLMNVAFMDASYGNPTQWNWNFGDGNTSTEQNPTHQYAQQGEYIVQLSISGEECSSSIIMDVFVGDSIWPPNDSCMAMFTYETNDNLTLMFQDISLGNPTEWQWDFGDGSTSAEQNPTHIYEEEGFYTVLLSINGSECSSTMMMDVFVGEYWWPNECLAMFYPWMDSLNTQTVHFIDESWGAENYFWSFGDGTSSTEQNPSHTYSETGIYEVMLTISSDSCESSFIMEINLDGSWQQENCQAFFFPEMEPGQTIVQFHDMSESIDGINSWSWNFGDGTTSTEQEPLHEYSSGGVYIVNLDITSQNRSTSSFTVELNTETGEYVAFMNYISTATNDLDNAGETCTIYPNPVINNLNININSKDASHARLVIINIAGQIIKSEECALGIGDNQYSIRTDDLENGVYILQIQYDSGVSTTKRFIK